MGFNRITVSTYNPGPAAGCRAGILGGGSVVALSSRVADLSESPSGPKSKAVRLGPWTSALLFSCWVQVVGPAYPHQGAAGKLPTGEQMVLVAWHHVESCSRPSLAAAFGFVAHYRFPPHAGESYKGDAPEQGVPI